MRSTRPDTLENMYVPGGILDKKINETREKIRISRQWKFDTECWMKIILAH